MLQDGNRVVPMQDFFNLPCLNVIWRLVCGRRFDYEDQRLAQLIEHMETFTMEQAIGPIAGISFLKYIPPFRQIYHKIKGLEPKRMHTDVDFAFDFFFFF